MRRNCNKSWPTGCLWPEPIWNGEGEDWEIDLVEMQDLDEDGRELLAIKEYMDSLVECGRLNADYSLNEDYEYEECDEADEEFTPELGIDYWEDGFDMECWEEDLSHHINLLKIDACDSQTDPVSFVRQVTGYSFINENILRQAFTRRSFGKEYDLGDCEELEFYGDAVLHTIVSHELYRRFSDLNTTMVEGPFRSQYPSGVLTAIRTKFVSRDHMSERAAELGLDQYILYGSGEEPSDSAREDMIEALIGAVAVDSNWDWSLLADVVDRLIRLQLEKPDELVKKSAYEQLNSWHQKHFGSMPEYTVDRNRRQRGRECYNCTLRYRVPENEKGIWTSQRIDTEDAPTRSGAREYAADRALNFLVQNGLWKNLSDAGIKPELENSINQMQELYQKKYLDTAPDYRFEEQTNGWHCGCTADGIYGWGVAAGKTAAKKKAAFMALVKLYQSAGLGDAELNKAMWQTMER